VCYTLQLAAFGD